MLLSSHDRASNIHRTTGLQRRADLGHRFLPAVRKLAPYGFFEAPSLPRFHRAGPARSLASRGTATTSVTAEKSNRRPGRSVNALIWEGRAMPSYRLYFLDAEGHIRRRLDLECRDDDEAIEQASAHDIGRGIELWCGARRVKKFKAPG